MDFALTDEQQMIQETGPGVHRQRDRPARVRTIATTTSTPTWCAGSPTRGYLGAIVPREYGGAGTEPGTGSDAANPANQKTRARRTDGGWSLSGAKMWISLGNPAKLALIFAQTDPEKGNRGLACFLVETDAPGFGHQEIHGKMGLHGSDTASLSPDDVEVPDGALLVPVDDGFKIAMSALDSGRYEGTSQIQKLIIGRAETGIDAPA